MNLHEQQEVFTVPAIAVVHAYDIFSNTGGFTVETYIRKSQKVS
jgi:predicted MFS family arabinose efflux permease